MYNIPFHCAHSAVASLTLKVSQTLIHIVGKISTNNFTTKQTCTEERTKNHDTHHLDRFVAFSWI